MKTLGRIAIFVRYYGVGNSPSFLNLVDFLSEHYWIDVFMLNVHYTEGAVFQKRNVRIIRPDQGMLLTYKLAKLRARLLPYRHYICFDPHGFCFCKMFDPKARPFYYSLELYMQGDPFGDPDYGLIYPKDVMERERREIHGIQGLIIQSADREELFRQEYGLAAKIPAMRLPVTIHGPSVQSKSGFLRQKYGIGPDERIALHLGGIADKYSSFELSQTFANLPGWILFFQGDPKRECAVKIRDGMRREGVRNVIVCDTMYDRVEDVNEVVQSCDVGLAWYNDICPNFRTVGRSSGKIASYLKFGLPVIANRYPSTVEAIERTDCGLCVEDMGRIQEALTTIQSRYVAHSKNARRVFERDYRFEAYEQRILDFIEGRSAG